MSSKKIARAMALGLIVATLAAPDVSAQEDPTPPATQAADPPLPGEEDAVKTSDMIVTATRAREEAFEVPRSITVVTETELYERNPLSVVDALDARIGVWVEKRTATTSDPVIRGLSGGNLLALIDFNTLSTFWGEGGFAGDDMYGKIDPETVERIEVIRGPSSVIYGSNALGGVLNFITRSSPFDYTEEGLRAGARIRTTYGSAAQEYRFRTETFGATPRLRYLLGYSSRSSDDMEGGRGVGVQSPTSGREENFDGKFQFLTGETSEITLAIQNVHRDPVHRFYRPNQDNENFRQGYSLTLRVFEPTTFWDEVETNVYYQYKKDRRRFLDSGDRGEALWRTGTADLKFTQTLLEDHTLSYGIGLHRDDAESPDDEQFTITEPDGDKYKAAPDTIWDNVGLWVHDRWRVTDRFTLTLGLRYDTFRFDSDPDPLYAANPAVSNPELDDFTDRENAWTGGVGLLYELRPEWNLFASYSKGFRQFAPSFGVRQLGFGVAVPNEFLTPVTADNYEMGVKWQEPGWSGNTAFYYTDFDNFQNLVPGTFQGSEFFDIEGDGIEEDDRVFVNKGNGDAYVYGVEIESSLDLEKVLPAIFGPEWSVGGGFMWNIGQDLTNDEPLRHTHPARGLLKARWDDTMKKRGLWWELAADFVRHFDRVPSGRLDSDPTYRKNPQDPDSGRLRSGGGLPGYTVLDLRGGINVTENASLTLAIENLTDKKYRPAHSRWDAPGINLLAGLQIVF